MDDMEKEVEKLSREMLVQERGLRETLFERDNARRKVTEVQSQAQDYLS